MADYVNDGIDGYTLPTDPCLFETINVSWIFTQLNPSIFYTIDKSYFEYIPCQILVQIPDILESEEVEYLIDYSYWFSDNIDDNNGECDVTNLEDPWHFLFTGIQFVECDYSSVDEQIYHPWIESAIFGVWYSSMAIGFDAINRRIFLFGSDDDLFDGNKVIRWYTLDENEAITGYNRSDRVLKENEVIVGYNRSDHLLNKPVTVSGQAYVQHNNKLYILSDNENDLYLFDIINNVYNYSYINAQFSSNPCITAISMQHDYLFIIGGYNTNLQRISNETRVFNIDKHLWISNNHKPYLNTAREYFVCQNVDQMVYAIGGYDRDSNTDISSIEVLHIADGVGNIKDFKWEYFVYDLPVALNGHRALVYNEQIIVTGGKWKECKDRVGSCNDRVYVINTFTKEITDGGKMAYAVWNAPIILLYPYIYQFGGAESDDRHLYEGVMQYHEMMELRIYNKAMTISVSSQISMKYTGREYNHQYIHINFQSTYFLLSLLL